MKATTMSSNHDTAIENTAATALKPLKTSHPRPEPMLLKIFQLAFSVGGHVSARIASYFAYKLWLTPTRHKTPASERYALASATIKTLPIHHHNITTYCWGTTGPSVLLVHGWSGRGTQLGAFVSPLLEAGYQVLSFDAPAHGQSSGKQTNLFEISDVILALQQYFGEFDAIITHSFGGPCTAFAVKNGLQAKCIISICPPATTIGLVNKFIRTLHLTKKTGDCLIKRMEKAFGNDIWQRLSMSHLVKKITIPGFIIHDAHDTDVPWEEGQAVAYAWNQAALKITHSLGHRRILKNSDVIDATIAFISKNRERTPPGAML